MMRHHLTRHTFYCDDATMRQLRRLAADRHITVSHGIRVCLAEYFALRAELAAAVAEPGQLGEVHTGILHQVLSTTEARLAASFTTHEQQIAHLHHEFAVVQAMLDRAVLLYLLHTSEVPTAERQTAEASGKRRHEQWQKAVTRILQTGALPSFGGEEETEADRPHGRTTTKGPRADGHDAGDRRDA